MEWLFWAGAFLVILFGFMAFFGAPYVPSRRRDVTRAFTELYRLSKKDTLLDIGSGDGSVLRAAAGYGAQAIGFELNPVLVIVSQLLSRRLPGVKTQVANMWRVPFPPTTTVVYVFSVSRDAARLRQKLQAEATKLNRPLKVICYGTTLADTRAVKHVGAHCLYEFYPLHA